MKKVVLILLVLLLINTFACCATPENSGGPSPTATPTGIRADGNTPTAAASPEPTPSPTPAATAIAPVSVKIGIAQAYPALTFNRPLYFTIAGDGSGDCYVVEQTGRIMIFEDSPDAAEASVFLDLGNIIDTGGNEKGLLGLAFHPDYANNGYLYVNYTNKQNTVIARYTRQPDNPREADPESEQVLLTFSQPYKNHNGGQLAFGPDGYLYIGTGDGGSSGDPDYNAQDRTSYLGKILRIDVDHPQNGKAYGIPADNPYAGNTQGYMEEIYAFGLRNPWRFSFDKQGTLWVGDVGQNKQEEIDRVEKGGNYGWNVMEGTLDYKDNPEADKAGFIPPIWEYSHGENECVTGGYVYGGAIRDLKGRYIYGDYVSGRIWALWIDDNNEAQNQELIDTGLNISSFGITADGDIRIVDLSGKIYLLKAAEK